MSDGVEHMNNTIEDATNRISTVEQKERQKIQEIEATLVRAENIVNSQGAARRALGTWRGHSRV